MSGQPPMEFSMPMYREFVPKAVRPWIYVFFAMVFQLSGGIYLGCAAQMAGATSFMREDIMMAGLCGVVGVCMPFPFLFRFKFRFTNKQLLLNAATVIIICNLLCLYVRSLPLLCVISFIAGFCKLCGTFECMSNIQLWMAPGRDFTLFFPLLYIIIIGDMSMSSWIANHLAYFFGGWEAMHWFMIGLLSIVMLCLLTLTRNFRIMLKIPLISVDWLGCILWALTLLEAIWMCIYGEHCNWLDSRVFCAVALMFPVTLAVCLKRMFRIRHPYIDPKAFTYKGLLPVLALFAVCELMSAGSKSLQNVFLSSVMDYGPLTMTVFSLWEYAGVVIGCLFVILWVKLLKLPYTRMLTLGFAALLCYHIIMYFTISLDVNIGRFYLPTALRTFGYSVFFCVLTIYLEEKMSFQHFFMGLTICGFVRNGLAESMASAAYSHWLRYYIADYALRFTPSAASSAVSGAASLAGANAAGQAIADRMTALAPMMSGIKTLFGWTCVMGCIVLIVFMLYDIEPVRRTFRKMPSWKEVGHRIEII